MLAAPGWKMAESLTIRQVDLSSPRRTPQGSGD